MKRNYGVQDKVVFALCGLVALMATLVAFGWIFKLQYLVQFAPGLAPMQFNTALGLIGLATALVLCQTKHRRVGALIALATFSIGALSLLEWIPGFAIGLDQFFIKSNLISAQSPIPGRMSPITAACFVFFSIGLIGSTLNAKHRSQIGLLGIFSTFSGLTCLLTLISSISQLGVISEWTQVNQMAIPTGICIMFLSVAGFISACYHSLEGKRIMVWVAASAVLGLSVGTFIWEQAEISQEHRQATVITTERAEAIKFQLESQVRQDARALDRLANRMTYGLEDSAKNWDRDVSRYMADCQEYEAIEWIDRQRGERWNEARHAGWTDSDLGRLSQRRFSLAKNRAFKTGDITGSGILDFGADGHGFAVFTPIRKNGVVTSVIAGFFRASEMMKALPVRTLERYRLEDLDNVQAFYLSGGATPLEQSPLIETSISTYGTHWKIRVSANEKLLTRFYSPLPKLILVCGLLTSLLVGFLILLAHKARTASSKEKEARRFLESLSEASMTLTYIVDLDRKAMTYCNRYGAHLMGLEPGDMERGGDEILRRFVHPEDQVSARNHFAKFATLPDGEIVEFEQRLLTADGTYKWMLHRECVHSRKLDGTPFTILGVGHDISGGKRAEESIRHSKEVLDKVIDDAAIGMALVSPTGKWLRVNQSLCDLVGYTPEELLATSFQAITHPEDLRTDEAFVAQVLAGDRRTYEMEKRYIHKDGRTVWILLGVSLIRDQDEKPLHFISQILDITERKAASMKLEEYAVVLEIQKQDLLLANNLLETMATTDGLTGVANRRQFDEELQHLFNSAQRYHNPLSIILVDIDHFKSVNDRFGHLTGDAILCQVAEILKSGARESDIVARYGGEEFAVICPQTDLVSATFLARRLRQSIEEGLFECGSITASFGVASAHGGDAGTKELLNKADEALYQSKRDGRNRVTMANLVRDAAA